MQYTNDQALICHLKPPTLNHKHPMSSKKNNSPTLAFGVIIGALASVLIGILRFFTKQTPKDKGLPKPQLLEAEETPQGTSQASNLSTRVVVPHPREEDGLDARWSRTTKYIVGTLLFLALLGLIFVSSSAIPLIVFAAIMAFLVQPIISFFEKKMKVSRGIATALTYFLVLFILISLPIILIPILIDAANFLLTIDVQGVMESLTLWAENLAAVVDGIPFISVLFSPGLNALLAMLQGVPTMVPPEPVSLETSVATFGDRLARTAGILATILGPIISAFVAFFFTLMISLYLSLSGEQLYEGFVEIFPPAYKKEWVALMGRLGAIWSSFLRAQLVLMVVIGIMVWIGNLILGTPQALFLGIFAGLMEVIPSLGPILAAIPAVILAFLFGSQYFAIEPWIFALIIIGFYVLIQFLENQFLVPKILGDALDLPPLIVLLGVFIGGALFGILGIFLATPVISSGREIFMYLYNKILEVPPPPEIIVEEKLSWQDRLRRWRNKVKASLSWK